MAEQTLLVQRKDHIVMRKIAGETILIPINQTGVDLQHVYILNSTAATLWQLLEEKQTVLELISAVQEQYEGDYATISSDVRALLADLETNNFISYFEA